MAKRAPSPLIPSAAMVAAGIVTAAATSEWWVVPFGLVAAGLYWAFSPRERSELPQGLDPAHTFRAQRMLETRDTLLAQLDSAPDFIKGTLAVSGMRIRDLATKFLRLLAKHQEIERFLDANEERLARLEREQLSRQVESASDAVAKERFQAALAAKDAQLSSRDELRNGLARLDGELATIQASLESVVAQLVRMKSAEARSSYESESGQVERTLRELTSEVDAVAQSIESVFEPPARERQR